MPSWLTKKNLTLAACGVTAAAVLLFPGGLVTLGIGAALGYKGRAWIRENLVSQFGGRAQE